MTNNNVLYPDFHSPMPKRENSMDKQNKQGGGGGNPPSDIGERVAHLESDVSHIDKTLTEFKTDTKEEFKEFRAYVNQEFRDIRTDIRSLLYFMIAGFLGLAAIMAKGFGWI